jgi:hypothetical protein
MPSTTAQVAAAADDQRAACGVAGTWNYMDDAGLRIGDGDPAAFDWVAICRMTLAVPKDATINTATMTVVSDGSFSVALTAKIYALAADNPAMPASAAAFTSATKTTASVAWVLGSWSPGGTVVSSDCSTVVQEIVNRAGWVSGNNIVMVIGDNVAGYGGVVNDRHLVDYNATPASAPKLDVDYTASGATLRVPIQLIQVP